LIKGAEKEVMEVAVGAYEIVESGEREVLRDGEREEV
jgi:hypothetical protein